jgi:4-aminobutyrate aminotransferase-like enzyme
MEQERTRSLKEEVNELHEKFIAPCVHSWHDVVFVEGKGTKLKDSEGKEYLDCFAGVAVVNAGHCHPKIVKAVQDQAEKLTHLSSLFQTAPEAYLAKKISDKLPMQKGSAKKIYFCNSGSEANDHAITLAKKYSKKFEIISLQNGYHGRTGSTISATGIGSWLEGMGPFVPGFLHAPSYYCYRCPLGYKEGPPSCGYACAQYIKHMLGTESSGRVAAYIAEPAYGVGGVIPAPPEYFKEVKKILDANDILFIADEVQTGFGRMGTTFGMENYGVIPDIVTMAKGLASGFPIGAVASTSEIADSYHGPTFSTYGGNPVSCAAALANLEVIEEENLVENSARVGRHVLKELKRLENKHPSLDAVDGMGLMVGGEIVLSKRTKDPAGDEVMNAILHGMLERGVIIGRGGLLYNRIRFQPPLTITDEEVDIAIDALDSTLAEVERDFNIR